MYVVTLKSKVLGRLSEADFLEFCLDNRDLRIERDSNGRVTIMPPVYTEMGFINADLSYQLAHWNYQRSSGKTFDSSAGFTLPTKAMLSPDASWIAQARWDALSAEDRRGFARICPDFVAELLSPTDHLPEAMRKMEHWLEAGARLGWLLAPATETAFVFEPGQPIRTLQGFDQELSGDPVLAGFSLDLRELRQAGS